MSDAEVSDADVRDPDVRSVTGVRVVLAVYAVALGVTGAWAAAFPRSFFDDYPGPGLTWVSPDGPFNEHLVRDVGTLNLALATLVAVAVVRTTPLMIGVAAGVNLVNAVPHLTYHVVNRDVLDASDQVTSLVTLVAAAATPLALLWWVTRRRSGALDGDA